MCSQLYDVLMWSINSMAHFLNLGWFLHIWKYHTADWKWHYLVSLIIHSLIWLKYWTRFIYSFCHNILTVYLLRFVSKQFINVQKLFATHYKNQTSLNHIDIMSLLRWTLIKSVQFGVHYWPQSDSFIREDSLGDIMNHSLKMFSIKER